MAFWGWGLFRCCFSCCVSGVPVPYFVGVGVFEPRLPIFLNIQNFESVFFWLSARVFVLFNIENSEKCFTRKFIVV